jgi:tRNA pseudouridine55 synthase
MLDGVLIVDKPAGMTSHDVVARVRRILGERRIGHTGTLDPFATGVMVLLIGRATRLARFLNTDEKEYQAMIRFGYATDTGDWTGKRLEPTPPQNSDSSFVHTPGPREIEAALESLKGEIDQVPPMYSAKKVDGQRLYDLARRGIEVERAAVRVTIKELELIPDAVGDVPEHSTSDRAANQMKDVSVRVVCSAGTYIRTLAETIGQRLGFAAHLAALRRTRAGRFAIDNALALGELAAVMEAGNIEAKILAPDAALSELPFVHLTADEARKARHGLALPLREGVESEWREDQPVRMRDADNHLIAVAFYDAAAGSLRPRIVLSPEN